MSQALERIAACLLDHYLACYQGNRDALASEAERLLPDWRALMAEWKPTPAVPVIDRYRSCPDCSARNLYVVPEDKCYACGRNIG